MNQVLTESYKYVLSLAKYSIKITKYVSEGVGMYVSKIETIQKNSKLYQLVGFLKNIYYSLCIIMLKINNILKNLQVYCLCMQEMVFKL